MAPAITDRASPGAQRDDVEGGWGIPPWLRWRRWAFHNGAITTSSRGASFVPYTLVLLLHGQKARGTSNRFTGWIDVD
jgi:hypothetical protein